MKRVSLLIVLVALLLCACSSSSDKDANFENSKSESKSTTSDKKIVFQDLKFERYIKSYLGKSTEDSVGEKELSTIEELVIDRRFVDVVPSEYYMIMTTILKMDLSDLKYFENLQKLEIQNANGDIFYNIDTIAECENLTDLSINYDFVKNNESMIIYNDYPNEYGYKTLFRILDKLPKLQNLQLGHGVSNFVIKEIANAFPNLTITTASKEINPSVKYMDGIITNISDIDVLSKDTTIINLYLENGEDVNSVIQKAASFEKLTVLRISTHMIDVEYDLSPLKGHKCLEEIVLSGGFISLKNDVAVKIKDNKALSQIPKLQYLTLGLASISDEELSELKQLKSLSLYRSSIDGLQFLSSCTDLYQLDISSLTSHGDNDNKIQEFIDGMKKQRNLQYLSVHYGGGMLAYCPEAISNMKHLREFIFVDSDQQLYFNMFDFSQNIELKRIVFSNRMKYDTYDLEKFRGLKNLEILWLNNSEKYTHEDILLELENLHSIYCEKTTDRGIRDLSEVLVQLPKLSTAIIQLGADRTEGEEYYQALYDVGINEGHFSLEDWNKGLE